MAGWIMDNAFLFTQLFIIVLLLLNLIVAWLHMRKKRAYLGESKHGKK